MRGLNELGAPALPPGWFYRVRTTFGTVVRVQVRERRGLLSVVRGEVTVITGVYDTPDEAVKTAATEAAALAIRQYDDRRFVWDFVGDHEITWEDE